MAGLMSQHRIGSAAGAAGRTQARKAHLTCMANVSASHPPTVSIAALARSKRSMALPIASAEEPAASIALVAS